ncbi:L domain-like protein [Cadophora sp. DSE1049]|nr:L domain-like protein [Cadophora sp. DSE1049]
MQRSSVFNAGMPDPLSIAVGVASLVATAARLLHTVNTYRAQYSLQDLCALSIKLQCDCILVALAQIQSALLSNEQVAARLMCEDSFSGPRLKSVLGACEVTFAVVVGRLTKLTKGIESASGGGLFSRRDKLERMWKECEIAELSENISRISDGLNLLLTAVNMKSQLEVRQILTSSRASIILDQVADDAMSISLAGCNASHISESVALRDQDSMLHTEINPKDFSFDQEVLMTPAYRKVNILRPDFGRSSTKRTGSIIPRKPLPAAHQPKVGLAMPSTSHQLDQVLDSKPLKHDHVIRDQEEQADSQLMLLGELPNASSPDTEVAEHTELFTSDDGIDGSELAEPVKITLRDFMPKSFGSHISDEISIKPLANHASTKHKLWLSATEINISGMHMLELPDRAIQSVSDTLQSLFLYDNSISTLPAAMTMCRNLTYLNLRANRLKRFPLEICNIRSLQTLHLSQNVIMEIPTELGNLKELTLLNIAFNSLTHLPLVLAQMDNLAIICAQQNPFIDSSLQIYAWSAKPAHHWDTEYCKTATRDLKLRISGADTASAIIKKTPRMPPLFPFLDEDEDVDEERSGEEDEYLLTGVKCDDIGQVYQMLDCGYMTTIASARRNIEEWKSLGCPELENS